MLRFVADTPSKKLLVLGSMILIAGILVTALLFSSYGIIKASAAKKYAPEQYAGQSGDKIHFLNTKSSDCILIESDGHFALVDCAEDSANPSGKAGCVSIGHEKTILDYLAKTCADESGNIHLDFIVGTHAHSDHIGCFDEVLNDPRVSADTAYLKRYHEDKVHETEIIEWDNREVYEQMIAACNENGVTLVQDIPEEEFAFGNFRIRLLNTAEYTGEERQGENENSLAVYVTKGEQKILLMGDVNWKDGDEQAIGKEIGKVDLLKVGHHGYDYSTGSTFIAYTKPKIGIFTNTEEYVSFPVKFRLTLGGRTALYATADNNGIIAVIGDNDIKLYNKIH